MRLRRPGKAALAGCLWAIAHAASAQWLGGDYATYGAPYSNYVASSFMNQTFMNQAAMKRAKSAAGKANATLVPPGSQTSDTAKALAARFPPGQQPQIEQAFVQSFASYQRLEGQFFIPKNDLAGAVAAFLAGNYMAYHGSAFPDQHFSPLVAQVRGILAASAPLASASPADKRRAYEQMAMVGVFMATGRDWFKRHPDAKTEAHFRETARANLQQLLQVDPDRLEIGSQGLVLH